MENAIEIKGLCKNWPSFRLKNVDIKAPLFPVDSFCTQSTLRLLCDLVRQKIGVDQRNSRTDWR